MNKRTRMLAGLGVVLIVLALAFAGCKQRQEEDIGAQQVGVMNVVVPTYALTGTPGFVIENKSAGAVSLSIENASGTPVVYVPQGGDITLTDDLVVGDTLDVNGDIDLDGDNFDVVSSAGFSIDAATASNVSLSGAGADLTILSDAGRVVIKGDEAAANAIHIDANDVATTGVDIDVGSVSGLTIDGGMVDIGGGTCGVADGDNDVCIAAVLEVDGELELDGALDADSTADIADTLTLSKGSGNALVISASGAAEINGTITLANDETIVNSTDDVVAIGGQLGYRQYVVDKTADYTCTLGESGALFTNDGASGAITFTLPSPSLGTVYGFLEQDDYDIFISPASGDQILSETDAADDDLGQATQYGVIWIVSDGTNWFPVSVIGTWDDESG